MVIGTEMSKVIGSFKKAFKQALPKKLVVSSQVKVTQKYECTVSMWVPNIPYSKDSPGIALTIRHGRGDASEYFRLIFKQVDELKIFMGNLNLFVLEKLPLIKVAHAEALGEWLEKQALRQNSSQGRISECGKPVENYDA